MLSLYGEGDQDIRQPFEATVRGLGKKWQFPNRPLNYTDLMLSCSVSVHLSLPLQKDALLPSYAQPVPFSLFSASVSNCLGTDVVR